MHRLSRRGLLVGGSALLLATACRQPSPRPAPTTEAAPLADLDKWSHEAAGLLQDAIDSLRTFDTFHAFRLSTVAADGQPLSWDPPTSAAWNDATHVARSSHGRASSLFQAISTARVDPSQWRDLRAAAEHAHGLIDLADALAAYRDRVDQLPPGDALQALPLLEQAWSLWDNVAAPWGFTRAEPIAPTNS